MLSEKFIFAMLVYHQDTAGDFSNRTYAVCSQS